jgi:hypothetical protein
LNVLKERGRKSNARRRGGMKVVSTKAMRMKDCA